MNTELATEVKATAMPDLPPLSLLPGNRDTIGMMSRSGGVLDPRADLMVISTRAGRWALTPGLFFYLAHLPDWRGLQLNQLGAMLWLLHIQFNWTFRRGLFFGNN